jgi:hypothetical protein
MEKYSRSKLDFDAGSPVFVDGKLVNANIITINPTASTRILDAVMDSQVIGINISGGSNDIGPRSFSVQPCLRALSKLIAACSVR